MPLTPLQAALAAEIAPKVIEKLQPLIDKIVEHAVEKMTERITVVSKLFPHIAEHEITGSARVIDPVKANDPSIPCTCFSYKGEDYCYKSGYLGLISPKRNPEQMTSCQIKIPASGEAQERFVEFNTAISEAHERWKERKGGLPEWWEEIGKSLESHGLEI